MAVDYHIIVNPLAGAGKAQSFIDSKVIPLLESRGLTYTQHEAKPGLSGSGDVARSILSQPRVSPTRVIVAGGDGTAHELIDGVLSSGQTLGRWELVILPLGTANALHSSLFPPSPSSPDYTLTSLESALDGKPPRRLPVTKTVLSGPEVGTEESVSHIVQSTSLHANLLHDSEALRSSIAGLERFKVAAKLNIGEFFSASVALHGNVRQWDPKKDQWREPYTFGEQGDPKTGTVGEQNPKTGTVGKQGHPKTGTVDEQGDPQTGTSREVSLGGRGGEGRVGVSDEFGYFLASSTTPRLEPAFVILPTLVRGEEGTMDLIVLRPLRDPRVRAVPETAASEPVAATATKPVEATEPVAATEREGRGVASEEHSGGEGTEKGAERKEAEEGPKEEEGKKGATFSPRGQTWARRAQEILTAAYANGSHISLCLPTSPHLSPEAGLDGWEAVPASDPRAGEPVAEVFRCTGFSWVPIDADSKAGLVCADGSIHRVPHGGRWDVDVLDTEDEGFWVYGP